MESLSASWREDNQEVLNIIRTSAGRAEFPISDLFIGPPAIDTVRTAYFRKAKFLSLIDVSLELVLFNAKTLLTQKQQAGEYEGDEQQFEAKLYQQKRIVAMTAQARELYSQGPEFYDLARREGNLITDGCRCVVCLLFLTTS